MESTSTKVAKGTPAYMPPEAHMGDCSAKWDVWSFGVVGFSKSNIIASDGVKKYKKDLFILGFVGDTNKFASD